MVILIYIMFGVLTVVAVAPPRGEMLRRALWVVCGVALFLVAALRPASSVPDYTVYQEMYASVVSMGSVNFVVEPSFSVISLFVDRWLGHPIFLFVIYAALGVCLKLTAIRRLSELWFLSLLLYFSTFFLLHEMVQIRAGVATGFILLGIKPLYDRKLGLWLLLMACAVLFHYSALAALILWFLPRRRRINWFLWGIIPVGCILYLARVNLLDFVFPIQVIQGRIQDNMTAQASGIFENLSIFGPGLIMRMCLYYLLLGFHSKLLQHNRYVTLLLYIYAIGLFVTPAFGTVPVLAVRLSDIFVVVEIVLVPMLLYVVSPRLWGRCAVAAVAFCHLLLALALGERLIF